jgi:cobalamin synthase
MKKYSKFLDIALIGSLGIMAFLTAAPDTITMSLSVQMICWAWVIILAVSFLALLWRENPEDERELFNQAVASRRGYIVGVLVLLVAVLVEGIQDKLDPALPLALLAMIATKILVQRHEDDK